MKRVEAGLESLAVGVARTAPRAARCGPYWPSSFGLTLSAHCSGSSSAIRLLRWDSCAATLESVAWMAWACRDAAEPVSSYGDLVQSMLSDGCHHHLTQWPYTTQFLSYLVTVHVRRDATLRQRREILRILYR